MQAVVQTISVLCLASENLISERICMVAVISPHFTTSRSLADFREETSTYVTLIVKLNIKQRGFTRRPCISYAT